MVIAQEYKQSKAYGKTLFTWYSRKKYIQEFKQYVLLP